MSFVRKRKTARPWAKRGVQGTELLQGIPGAIPKVEKEKRKVAKTRKEVSKNHECDDQKMFEQFLARTSISYLRIPDLVYFLLFSRHAPTYAAISDGQRAYMASYLAGRADTFLFFRVGDTPYLVARTVEQKVKGRTMNHRQELRAAEFGTQVADTVDDSIRMTLEARDMRDLFANFLKSIQPQAGAAST